MALSLRARPGRASSCSAGGSYASLRLPSGDPPLDVRCRATVGEAGNAEQANINQRVGWWKGNIRRSGVKRRTKTNQDRCA